MEEACPTRVNSNELSDEAGATGRALVPMFTEGGVPGPGRPKGSLNRTTIMMRQAIAAVFEDLQAEHKGEGRYPHFHAWAKEQPDRILPDRGAADAAADRDGRARSIGLVVFKGLND